MKSTLSVSWRKRMNVLRGGRFIKTRREEMKLGQVTFAEKAGLSQKNLSRLERGEIENPGIKEILGVAKALGISREDLLKQYE